MAGRLMHAPIILLREGTDTSQGLPQILANISACEAIASLVKSTLGPRGMDKLIHTSGGGREGSFTVTNDGATVVDLLDVTHPAARLLVDVARAQDEEVGDGTTSVVLLTCELLTMARELLEEGLAPQLVIRGYQAACATAIAHLQQLQISLCGRSAEERNVLLRRCASTSLNSKLLASHKDKFAQMVVDAVLSVESGSAKLHGPSVDKKMIGIKKVPGGSLADSFLVEGVAFRKTFSYAGFEQQPKKFKNAKVLLLNIELELKAEKENAEVRISDPSEYQRIVEAEWKLIFDKLEAIVRTGANVVLSRLPIGDIATQFFADRNVFCAGRVEESDMQRTVAVTGAQIQTTLGSTKNGSSISQDVLGTCEEFEEVQLGGNRYNMFRKGGAASHAVTIVLRGSAQQFLDEAERSLNDAIMIVRRAVKTNAVIGGGGAIEMALSKYLREEFRRIIPGKSQLAARKFSEALEVIPRVLAQNSGCDTVACMNKLRQLHNSSASATKHTQGATATPASSSYSHDPSSSAPATTSSSHGNPSSPPSSVCWAGVDCVNGSVFDAFENFVWEPALVKLHALSAATEAATLILSIDHTIQVAKSNPDPVPQQRGMRGAPGRRM